MALILISFFESKKFHLMWMVTFNCENMIGCAKVNLIINTGLIFKLSMAQNKFMMEYFLFMLWTELT